MLSRKLLESPEVLLQGCGIDSKKQFDVDQGRSATPTTSTDDRYIQLTARRKGTENATQLQRQLLLATGRRVFSQTVRNRLHEGVLCTRVPIQSCSCMEDRGTYNSFVKGPNELVGWYAGGISIYGPAYHSEWHFDGPKLCRNTTSCHLRFGDSFVFQDDNARPHRARLVENMLEAETIKLPACSLT
ncbi:hypothetical protein TNCV_159431 [Trichonephila clavipes]|uniref:Uncharacterized protein n=1 Tax=Trichonephila clavipes TaxID=2585209 RepID=A0A8X6UYC4_TRICX|nr:hypothetical protein TNCV_159431 [Trichonephila clavipes]